MVKSSTPCTLPALAPEAGADVDVRVLLRLLRVGDVDAAIEAGLMCLPHTALAAVDDAARAVLTQTRQRLLAAWAARGRFRARQARLRHRERERQTRRMAVAMLAAPVADTGNTQAPAARAVLPAAAAAALTRARSRALSKST